MKHAIFLTFAIMIEITVPYIVCPEEIPILCPIPPIVQEIDVTYTETAPPRLSLRSAVPPHQPSPLRPTTARFNLVSIVHTAEFTGSCQASRMTRHNIWIVMVRAADGRSCRAVFGMQRTAAIDVLSYDTVALKGYASQPVTVALAHGVGEPPIPLARLAGRFDLRLALKPIFSCLDPTHIVSIVLDAEGGDTMLQLEDFSIE